MSTRCTSLFLLLCAVLALPLFAGDSVVLSRNDGTPIVQFAGDDPVVQLRETAGGPAVFRLRIDDASRVIALGPNEERTVHLRRLFDDSVLGRDAVIVDTLRGSGTVIPSAEFEARSAAHRRAIAPARVLPTSTSLIDAAEKSGTLDSETALLYRVYAMFADARLPAQYRGDDSAIIDSLYLVEVAERFASLSPSTQAAVTPFLVPPAYKGSWATRKAGSATAMNFLIGLTPCKAAVLSDSWRFVDAMDVPVRVWYDSDVVTDALYANGVAAEVDSVIWPKLIGLMHPAGSSTGFPLNDEAESCNGGNNRLDIYLTDGSSSYTAAYESTRPTPAFITLVRGEDFGVAAHEVFHAIQFSFPTSSSLGDLKWWYEGSANWAIDYVYGKSHQKEQDSAVFLLNFPTKPLDEDEEKHYYSTYLLPFYLARKTGNADFVRQSWLNIGTKPPLDAIDAAIGGFDKVWPQVARYDWNQAPFDDYKKWDDLPFAARPEENGTRTLSGREVSVDLPYELPRLSATYHHFKFDDSLSSIVFWNGVTTKLAKRDISGGALGPQYVNDSADGDAIKGAHVTALVDINGNWDEQDWTGKNFVTFCRDLVAERIDELVLIISNSEFKDPKRTLKPPGLPPVLYASNMGCWKWKGHASFGNGGGVTFETDVTWTRAAGTTQPLRIDYTAEGTANWSISTPNCSQHGTASLSSSPSSLSSFNLSPTDSQFLRTYVGAGGVQISACGAMGSFPWLEMPPEPLKPGNPVARFLYVSPDGKTMDDSFAFPNSPPLSKWHFEAQRE